MGKINYTEISVDLMYLKVRINSVSTSIPFTADLHYKLSAQKPLLDALK